MIELTYSKHDDYILPDLALPESDNESIGKYLLLRKKYLKTHRRVLYINFLTGGMLYTHLSEIARRANDRIEHLTVKMAKARGITEMLKAAHQMAWIGAMNNIRACAEEIVFKELICS